MQDRDFKGVWIPKEIWLNKDMTMLEKVIYTEISSLDNEKHCIAGNEYFAEFCNCSESAVTKTIRSLKDKGLIEELAFDGRHRTLSVVKFTKQSSKIYDPASQNLLSNNIDTNTKKKEEISNTKVLDISESGKSPKKNLFQKCVDIVYDFSTDEDIRELLVTYLKVRLEIKDKPLYTNQFKGSLNKIRQFTESKERAMEIIQYSIDHAYLTFYDFDKNYGKKSNTKQAWNENVKSVSYTEDERKEQEEFRQQLEKEGKQVIF